MKIYYHGVLTADEHLIALRYIQKQRNVTKAYVSKTRGKLTVSVYSDPGKEVTQCRDRSKNL